MQQFAFVWKIAFVNYLSPFCLFFIFLQVRDRAWQATRVLALGVFLGSGLFSAVWNISYFPPTQVQFFIFFYLLSFELYEGYHRCRSLV